MNFFTSISFFIDLSRLRYLNNRKSNTLICSESGLAWFPGCSSCAGFNWFNPHLMRVQHECILDYYHQITLRLFFQWSSFPMGPQTLSALLFEFRVAICFFVAICLVLHSSRFCTVVGFCAFLGFFIPFYITGKAFVYLLPFYIFYDVCVAICFSPTRLKDVGRLCHLFPLP